MASEASNLERAAVVYNKRFGPDARAYEIADMKATFESSFKEVAIKVVQAITERLKSELDLQSAMRFYSGLAERSSEFLKLKAAEKELKKRVREIKRSEASKENTNEKPEGEITQLKEQIDQVKKLRKERQDTVFLNGDNKEIDELIEENSEQWTLTFIIAMMKQVQLLEGIDSELRPKKSLQDKFDEFFDEKKDLKQSESDFGALSSTKELNKESEKLKKTQENQSHQSLYETPLRESKEKGEEAKELQERAAAASAIKEQLWGIQEEWEQLVRSRDEKLRQISRLKEEIRSLAKEAPQLEQAAVELRQRRTVAAALREQLGIEIEIRTKELELQALDQQ